MNHQSILTEYHNHQQAIKQLRRDLNYIAREVCACIRKELHVKSRKQVRRFVKTLPADQQTDTTTALDFMYELREKSPRKYVNPSIVLADVLNAKRDIQKLSQYFKSIATRSLEYDNRLLAIEGGLRLLDTIYDR